MVGEVGLRACAGSLVGGLLPTHQWGELDLFPLMARAVSSGVFRVSYGLKITLGSCLLLGGSVFPPCWLLVLRGPKTEVCRLLGGTRSWCYMMTPGRTHTDIYSHNQSISNPILYVQSTFDVVTNFF